MYPNGARFAVQLSFDLEMVTNWPYWTSFWDNRKGAINDAVKAYVRKISSKCGEYGARAHYFVVGSLFEDPDIDYLREAVDAGHAVGNHTYTHINIKAERPDQLAGIYKFCPWRAAGRSAREVVRQEIRMTTEAIRTRLGVVPKGFRSPGGFPDGLQDAPEVRELLQEEGFWWASTHYNDTLLYGRVSRPPDAVSKVDPERLKRAFNRSERALQPYRYEDGLIEIPLAGITDVVAWRWYRPDLGEWLEMLAEGVDYAYEHGLIFMLTSHPAVLASVDPHCQVVETILSRAVRKEGGVWLPDLEELAGHLENTGLARMADGVTL